MALATRINAFKSKPTKLEETTQDNKCWQGLEKREPLCTVGGNVKCCSHCGKEYRGSSKIKSRTGMISMIQQSTSGYISKRIKNKVLKKYLHTQVHCNIFTVAKREQLRCPLRDEWDKEI